ncbi:hypothetical protein SEA_ROSEPHARIE_82 [Streptomyces phage RosePharie]|nr:hypothetical protein SEA_ROSEPHARIE_82 [Streptomyces phage RosePharie]
MLNAHKGDWNVGSVLTYKSYSSTVFNGLKVLKRVWLDEVSDYRYICQQGQIKDNAFAPSNGGKTLYLNSREELNQGYDQLWTKDSFAPVKGDILEGTDMYGVRVLVLFESDSVCHRLTKMNDTSQDVSSAGLDFYQRKLSGLKVIKSSYNGLPFSSIR